MDLKAAVRITAGVSGQQEVDRLNASLKGLQGAAGGLKAAFGALGGAVAAYQFVGFVKGAIDAADSLNDLRQRTGIAVEDLDALALAAEQNGSSLEAVTGSVQRLFRVMGSAAGGDSKAAGNLKQFGISLEEVRRGSITATEALARIADRVATMPDGFQKAAALQRIFGKSAAEIVPLMNAGGDAIRDARSELERYGALITGAQASAADEFNDKLAVLSRVARGAGLALANELLPVMTATIQGFLDAYAEADNLGNNTGLQTWAETAGVAVAVLVDNVRVAAQAISALVGSFKAVWADIELGATIIARGGITGAGLLFESNRTAIAEALEERNRVVEDANKQFLDLWNMDGSKYYDAVRKAYEGLNKVSPAEREPGGRPQYKPGAAAFEFDFGANDNAATSRAETAAKRRLDLLEQQRKKIVDYAQAQQGSIELLRLEGERVNMSSREYEALAAAKEHEIAVARETADMLPETAADYKKLADAIFATRQAVEEFNYVQSRTFEAGAKTAFRGYIEAATDAAAQSEKAFTDAFKGAEDALVAWAKTGELNVEALFDSIIENMLRMVIQQQVMAPLLQGLGGILGGGGAVAPSQQGGGLGGLLGGLLGNIFKFADGGVMSTGVGGVARSPKVAVFAEAGQAEAYVPLPDGRTIPVTLDVTGLQGLNAAPAPTIVEAPKVNVSLPVKLDVPNFARPAAAPAPTIVEAPRVDLVVNNYSSVEAKTTEATDARGNRRVEVTIGEAAAGEVRRRGSPLNNALRSTFAAAPTLTGR